MLNRFLKWSSLTGLTRHTDSHRYDAFGVQFRTEPTRMCEIDLGASCSCTGVTGRGGNVVGLAFFNRDFFN